MKLRSASWVSEYLGVPKQRVYHWLNRGVIPALKFPGNPRWYVPEDFLIRMWEYEMGIK